MESKEREGGSGVAANVGVATGVAALSAAALYFIGWQYKQSLALSFGLPNYPGDLSFQGTVATGLSVLDSTLTLRIAGALIIIGVITRLIRGIPSALTYIADALRVRIDKVGSDLTSLKEGIAAGQVQNDAVLARLDREIRRLRWQNNLARSAARYIRHSLIIVGLAIFVALVAILVTLFYAGHSVARMDAAEIVKERRGSCISCFEYETGGSLIVGIPLFQNSNAVFVYANKRLYRIDYSKLVSIEPVNKSDNGGTRFPRR